MRRMKVRSNKQLLFGHSLLHSWARDPTKTDWSKTDIIREHARLVRLMRKRGLKHDSPLKFSRKW